MKNNNKIYIISSIFILILLCLVAFFAWPIFKDIEKNSDDLVFAKNNLANLGTQINETNSFKKNYESYRENLDRISQLFVDPKNPVDFIEFLENTALSSKVTSQISLPPTSSVPQQFVMMQVTCKGSFSSILSLIKKIESGPYLIEIENLTIQNPDQGSQDKKDATLSIKVFTKK